MSERPEIILDCDPGHDDVIAILFAALHTDLVGITTVSGNAPLPAVTRNALAVCELFDLDVPVHAGCDRPIVAEPQHATATHGASGLDGTHLAEPTRAPGDAHAVEFLIETTRARPGLWLVPTGPLSNVALALRLDPRLVDRVAGISLMGGGARFGNVTATAEFNIWCDPEAAAIVFSSGAPVRMAGLDVTHQVGVTANHAEPFIAVGGPRATLIADVLAYYGARGRGRPSPMHDPVAVLAVTHPELLELVPRNVVVELAGGGRGTTVVDQRWFVSADDSTCLVAEDVQADTALELILGSLQTWAGLAS